MRESLRILQNTKRPKQIGPGIAQVTAASSPHIPHAQLIPRSQEDPMTVTHSAERSETTSAAPVRIICTSCKKNPLSYNNRTGVCGECQRSAAEAGRTPGKINGHNGAQLHRDRERQAAPHLVKSNEHRESAPHLSPESRVDLLLKALPLAEKVKMLTDWLLAGAP
jgi:hypothetical protein